LHAVYKPVAAFCSQATAVQTLLFQELLAPVFIGQNANLVLKKGSF
jgi:hypothetical protein